MRWRKNRRVRISSGIAGALMLMLTGCSPKYAVLDPAGPVGREELHLIILSAILTAVVIIPVLILLVFIVWRYRDKPGNKARYRPEWAEHKVLEFVWWGVPILIVAILGVVTARSIFALVQPPQKDVKPVTVYVTSLDWKWLFEYPDAGVATVNYCEVPTGVPVQFILTADAPINSFWVPQLGGQEYTMPGMAERLWLEADNSGTYYGTGANFTGKGFAHMNFNVIATSESKFTQWVSHVKNTAEPLTKPGYNLLRKPSVMGTKNYSSFPVGLFKDTIWAEGGQYMSQYMGGMSSTSMSPSSLGNTTNTPSGMNGMDMSNQASH